MALDERQRRQALADALGEGWTLAEEHRDVRAEARAEFEQALERQPPPGTTKDGGLRVGEMERDTFIAHGTSLALHERFMRTSDQYQIMLCDRCGRTALR